MAEKQSEQQAALRKLDKTVKGGRYVVRGKLVDANGQPLAEESAPADAGKPAAPPKKTAS